jgi:thiamine-monophosphate kinase
VPDVTAGQTVADLGEFGLIAAVSERIGTAAGALVGPGDDAAVLAAGDGRVVATTDVLVEGVHFRRDWSSAYDVGRKAAAANLADIAAMGATATALLVGLVVPGELPVAWALALAEGLRDEAARVGAAVVGGDTVSGGDLAGLAPVLRSGARPGDLVVLAGRTGVSAAGLGLLRSGVHDGPLVQAHLRPCPPYALGPLLARAGASAMCDVSDGLVADLGHLARASRVRVELNSALLDLTDISLDDALRGGEDHALVATIAANAARPEGCRVIGQVVAGEPAVTVDGAVTIGGWEHFS